MSPRLATFLFEVANFLLLAALLGWAFFRPVRAMLESRRASLEAQQRTADEKLAEAERLLADAARQRSELETSLASLRERVREEAERERSQLLDAAREQAQRERGALEVELAAERGAQAKRLATDAAAAARDIVARLLERIEGPDLEHALTRAASHELAELATRGPLTPIIVESIEPLEPEARDLLARAAGVDPSEIDTRQVADLGAGLRILTPRGLVDASAAALAAHAERALIDRLEPEPGEDG